MSNKPIIFSISCLSMFVFGVIIIMIGSTLPELVNKFTLNKLDTGSLISILPFGILFSSIFSGILIDRFGYKFIFIIGFLILIFSLFGIANSKVYYLLQFSVFFIGLAGGILNLLPNALVSEISEHDKSSKLSLLSVFFGLGALGVPLILNLLSKAFSVQEIINYFTLLLLIPVFIILFTNFPQPKVKTGFPLKKIKELKGILPLSIFGMALFFQSGMEGISSNWSAIFVIDFYKIDKNQSLLILTALSLGITSGRLLLSLLLKYFKEIKIVYLFSLLTLFFMIFLFLKLSFSLLLIVYFFIGAGLSPAFPVIFSIIGNNYSNIVGTAFSIILTLALIGNMILNYLVGVLTNYFGIQQYISVLIFSLLLFLFNFSLGNKIIRQ